MSVNTWILEDDVGGTLILSSPEFSNMFSHLHFFFTDEKIKLPKKGHLKDLLQKKRMKAYIYIWYILDLKVY